MWPGNRPKVLSTLEWAKPSTHLVNCFGQHRSTLKFQIKFKRAIIDANNSKFPKLKICNFVTFSEILQRVVSLISRMWDLGQVTLPIFMLTDFSSISSDTNFTYKL